MTQPLVSAVLLGSASALTAQRVASVHPLPRFRIHNFQIWMLATPFVALVSVYIAGPVGLLLSPVPFAINTTLRKRQTRIRSEFVTTELAPALQLIIGQLRIGRNIVGAISEVAGSIPSPLGELLNEAVANARLGTPIDIDLMRIAREEHNPHLEIVASAIGVQAKLGGSLTDILQTVVEDIEEEDRLRRDIRSLTADGRMSAQILLAMPPAMLIFVSIMSPGYAGPLISDPLGRIMSAAALCLAIVGVQWLRVLSTEQAKY